MTDEDLAARNRARLDELHPVMARKIAAVLSDLAGHGYRPRIQEAWRSPEAQRAAWASGVSKLKWGYHNATGVHGRMEALAADILDDDRPLAPTTRFLLLLAASAECHALVTGIRWGLPANMRRAIDRAIRERDWSAPVRIGWDANHVQVTGISVAEAQAGKRPA